jgi:hypothetical protein
MLYGDSNYLKWNEENNIIHHKETDWKDFEVWFCNNKLKYKIWFQKCENLTLYFFFETDRKNLK